MAHTTPNTTRPWRSRKGCLLAGSAGCISFLVLLGIFLVTTNLHYALYLMIVPSVQEKVRSSLPPDPEEEAKALHNQNYIKANNLLSAKEYAAAIPYWDIVLEDSPNGDSYTRRAICYFQLSGSQRNYSEYLSNLTSALADMDQAIALEADEEFQKGYFYELRANIYDSLASAYEQRDISERYSALAAENMRAAVALNASDPGSYRKVPFFLFDSGQCEEGLREVERIRAYEGVSAPPKSSVLNAETYGHLCLGHLEEALQTNNQVLEMKEDNDFRWLRARILFNLDRYEEALEILNRLIEIKPNYNGGRYYLRAAIYQAQGDRERALQDLETGSGNTWGMYGMRDYVLAQMAIEDGNPEEAIARLQSAMLTLPWIYDTPLMARMEQQLAELGARPPLPGAGPQITATPLPARLFANDPIGQAEVTDLNENGLPLPPFVIPVSISDGIEDVLFELPFERFTAIRMVTYLFSPAEPVQIRAVNDLVVHVETLAGESCNCKLSLWDQTSGEWFLFEPQLGANPVEQPDRYVDHQGRLYLATRNWNDERHGSVDELWVTLGVETEDGRKLILEKGE